MNAPRLTILRGAPAPIAAHACSRPTVSRVDEICQAMYARGFEWVDSDRLHDQQFTGTHCAHGTVVICWRPSRRLMANQ